MAQETDHQVNTTKLVQSGLPMISIGKKKATRKAISKQDTEICAESAILHGNFDQLL